jgi:GDP-L-fucose synthase
MIHNGPPHNSNEGYAYAKRLLEIQCKSYNQQFGSKYICIIPTNIYGPHDNFHLEDSHVIPGLIHRCFLAKQKNEPFVVRGTGKPLRQFIYSIDLAKIIMELILEYHSTESVIISPSEEHSILNIAEMINSYFNNKIYSMII